MLLDAATALPLIATQRTRTAANEPMCERSLAGADNSARARTVDEWFVQEVVPLEGVLNAYLRYHLHGAAVRVAGEPSDLRQEVFVRVYEAASISRPSDVAAFVIASARNVLIDHVRRAGLLDFATLDDDVESRAACGAPSPEQVVSGRQELALLRHALDKLPPACRKVVELRKIAGMSQREVADHLGLAEGTVEKQVSKGMRILADALLACGVEFSRSFVCDRAAVRRVAKQIYPHR